MNKSLKYISALLFLSGATIGGDTHAARHLISLQTAGGQEARLEAEVADSDDEALVVANPVLVMKNKTYRLAQSESTPALSDLICRKVSGKHLYAKAKYQKRNGKENSLETDRNLGLKKSKAKIVVRAFECVEEVN